ncbi:MAG: hypothetical protein E7Z91_02545 [Cyanobacteria bacterium SIG30]|nr:hypothetical protein [Cyanobacteria bacterium SIG30]
MSDKITEFPKNKLKNPANKRLLNKEGFAYVSMLRDINGFDFNNEHLKKYSQTNKYTITIAVEEKNKTILHNYFVSNEDITKFFTLYNEGKIKGEIIEIDKFNPEILA